MEKVDNIKIKESVYTEKLENGLKIIIIPKKNTLKKYISIYLRVFNEKIYDIFYYDKHLLSAIFIGDVVYSS